MVMEAVWLKVQKEDADAQKEAERAAWRNPTNKSNFTDLEQFR